MYNRLIQKRKLSLLQVNGAQNRFMFEHNQTLGISYALNMLLKQGSLFNSRPHYIMRSFIFWQWKNYHLVKILTLTW